MNPVRWAATATDRFFDRAGLAVKALTGGFPRGMSYWSQILPNSSFRYGVGNESGMGSALIIGIIGWTARNFVQAPIRLQSKKIVGGKVELDDVEPGDTGPGAFLSLLERPNPHYDGRLMQKAIVGDYETRGTAWVLKQRNGSDRVVALWWIPFALLEPRWPQDGSEWISHYEYNPNGVPYRVEPEDVIPFRDGMDPDNPRLGFNKVARLAREIYTDDEAANFSATVLTNLGVPGVIIAPKDTGIASRNRIEDPEGIKRSYMEKFTGDRRGEPLVLTSPTETTVLSWNPQQLTLKELRRIPEERASSVLGVPAIVANLGAGLDRSTFANFEEARAAGYEEKIIPLQGDFAPVWRDHLLSEFVGDVRQFEVSYDLSAVRVLAEDQNKLWERSLGALTKGGITRRRFKELVGEEADDTDDVYYIPTQVSIENAEMPPPSMEEPEPAQVAPGDAIALLGPGRTGPETQADVA
jgi:phage portal protein BeeE